MSPSERYYGGSDQFDWQAFEDMFSGAGNIPLPGQGAAGGSTLTSPGLTWDEAVAGLSDPWAAGTGQYDVPFESSLLGPGGTAAWSDMPEWI